MRGWVLLHKTLLEWEWYTDPNTFRLFIHCLLKANHEAKKWKGQEIKRGQFVTSFAKLSIELDLSVKKIRNSLDKLKKSKNLAHKGASSFSIITVINYDSYQDSELIKGNEKDKQRANKGQTKGNDLNNINKENKDIITGILEYLNISARKKRGFRPTDANMKFIRARLNEGYTLDDLKHVIDVKCEEWLGTTQEQYLRPETLFNATKFQTYINQDMQVGGSKEKEEYFDFMINVKKLSEEETEKQWQMKLDRGRRQDAR